MYGTAEELESNLKKYFDLYPNHSRFEFERVERNYVSLVAKNFKTMFFFQTTPTKFRNLKGELFYCKQELFLHFQVATHTAFRDTVRGIFSMSLHFMNYSNFLSEQTNSRRVQRVFEQA